MITGIGIDTVDVNRVASLMERYGERFLRRIFTENEIAYCSRKANPSPHFSARIAVKEAAVKALGTGFSSGIRFTDIEVHSDEGIPRLLLHGKAREHALDIGVSRMHVSLSHERLHATAIVLLEGNG